MERPVKPAVGNRDLGPERSQDLTLTCRVGMLLADKLFLVRLLAKDARGKPDVHISGLGVMLLVSNGNDPSGLFDVDKSDGRFLVLLVGRVARVARGDGGEDWDAHVLLNGEG